MVFTPTAAPAQQFSAVVAPTQFANPSAGFAAQVTSCAACGGPLKVAVCQKGQNAGRQYVACTNSAGPFCKKSFKWLDGGAANFAPQQQQQQFYQQPQQQQQQAPTGAVATGWPAQAQAAPVAAVAPAGGSGGVTLEAIYNELQMLKVEVLKIFDLVQCGQNVKTD